MLKLNSFLSKILTSLLLTLLLSVGSVSVSFAADDLNEILTDGKNVNLSKKDISSESIVPSEEDHISTNAVKKASLLGDYTAILGRSTYVGKTRGGTRQYHNSGNRNKANEEFNKIGGRNYEVISEVKNGEIIHRKYGTDGVAVLYRSTSKTDGQQRPTISFQIYKIRFLGD